MAQYQSTLTGPEIDAALQDMAQHDSEAWAVGTRDGSAVTSLDVTYENNAKYYAEEATGAAARAEAAVPAGTSGAVFFDQAQTLTDAQKARARTNIGAGAATLQYAAGGNGTNQYITFARISKVTWGANYHATLLVASIGGYSAVRQGVYIVDINSRSSSAGMYVKALVPSYDTNVAFGYYEYDGSWYFGAQRGNYGGSTGITTLSVSTTTANLEIKDFGVQSTAPTGWTTVTINS